MSDSAEDIPVKVEVNEEEKTVVLLIPWTRLGRVNPDVWQAWFVKADKVRKQWETKGYRCN